MKCPYCGYAGNHVVDSRPTEDDEAIRRRRECERCKKRFTTYERYETLPLIVVKKDESRENFSRQKVLNGMLKSCEKRPIPIEVLEEAVGEIENKLRAENQREVSSTHIAELIMEKLREIDQVAYVRFASVYRAFKDVDSFIAELKALKDET